MTVYILLVEVNGGYVTAFVNTDRNVLTNYYKAGFSGKNFKIEAWDAFTGACHSTSFMPPI